MNQTLNSLIFNGKPSSTECLSLMVTQTLQGCMLVCCYQCQKLFNSLYDLAVHMGSAHSNDEADDENDDDSDGKFHVDDNNKNKMSISVRSSNNNNKKNNKNKNMAESSMKWFLKNALSSKVDFGLRLMILQNFKLLLSLALL